MMLRYTFVSAWRVLLMCGILVSACQRSQSIESDSALNEGTDRTDSSSPGTETGDEDDFGLDTNSDTGAVSFDSASLVEVDLYHSWLLVSLKDNGQPFELNPAYSYDLDAEHPDVKLNFLVFSFDADASFTMVQGMFYRWKIAADCSTAGKNELIFNTLAFSEYPPFNLLEPLSEDFCPDACYAGKTALENVLQSVTEYIVYDNMLTLWNSDHSNAAVFQLSETDLSEVPY